MGGFFLSILPATNDFPMNYDQIWGFPMNLPNKANPMPWFLGLSPSAGCGLWGDAKVVAAELTEAHLTSGSAEHQKFSGGAVAQFLRFFWEMLGHFRGPRFPKILMGNIYLWISGFRWRFSQVNQSDEMKVAFVCVCITVQLSGYNPSISWDISPITMTPIAIATKTAYKPATITIYYLATITLYIYIYIHTVTYIYIHPLIAGTAMFQVEGWYGAWEKCSEYVLLFLSPKKANSKNFLKILWSILVDVSEIVGLPARFTGWASCHVSFQPLPTNQ